MMNEPYLEERDTFRVDSFGCAFTVYGEAAPGGSKRPLPAGGKRGGRILMVEDSKRVGPWRQQVSGVAQALMEGREPFEGPLVLRITFFRQRPAGHFGKKGLRPSAPKFPIVKPDLTKLVRPLEDALKGIVWRDDNQVVEQHIFKQYGEPARAEVRVEVKI